MKKILICLLACAMLLAMVGCSQDQDDIRGNQITETNPPQTTETNPPQTTEGTGNDQTEDKELSLGTMSGQRYESEFIGIGYNLDAGWEFYTDEDLLELNNYIGDIAGQDYLDIVKNSDSFYDMMAVSSSGTDNIVVTLEKVSNAQLNQMNFSQGLETVFYSVKTVFENMGCTNITHEITTVDIDGETFHALHISANYAGLTMRQTSLYIKCNGYLAAVALTTFDEDGTAPLLDNLYLLKNQTTETNPPQTTEGTGNDQTEDKELSLGTMSGQRYESEFIGIGYNLDAGWTFYTDEEIQELNNYVGDVAGYLDQLKKATVVYDMMAASSSGTDNIVVNLEKVSNAQLNQLDFSQVLENIATSVKTTFENMGYTNITYETTTVDIDGKTFPALHIFSNYDGMTMRQTSILIKCNGYLASVTVTTLDEAGTAPLLDNLFLLK